MLNNDVIMDFICQHFYVSSLRQLVWSSVAQDLTHFWGVTPRHKCNFHIGIAIFLDLNVPVFKRLKTWAFQRLKTHWLQPVFGGFLSRTGLIRNSSVRAVSARWAGVASVRGPASDGRSPGTQPRPRLASRSPAHQTVFTVSNESPLALKLTTLSLLTMK